MKCPVEFRTSSLFIRCIVLLAFFIPVFSSAQTFFGSSSNPTADPGAQAGPTPPAVIPPASMQADDLVIIYGQYRANGITISMNQSGGQTWNTVTPANSGSNQSTTIFWCTFNGTWSANPSIRVPAGNTNGLSTIMYVYRPSSSNVEWEVNVNQVNSSLAVNPNQITGVNTTANNTVTMAFWGSAAANTWSALTAGWTKPGLTQYRNTTTGQSHTAAYKIMATPGATGIVAQTQSVAGTTALRSIMSWCERPANDLCANAISLTSAPTCVNTAGTVVNASYTATLTDCSSSTPTYDVWYSFVAQTVNPAITLTLAASGANFNTPRMQLFSGACGGFSSLGCTTAANPGSGSINATGLTIGNTYYIRVYSLNGGAPATNGTFNICVTDPPPANDACAGAVSLTSGASCVNTAGTLYAATATSGISAFCGSTTSADVWYSFVAQSTLPTIALSSMGSNMDNTPRLQIFNTSSCTVATLNANSNNCVSGTNQTTLNLTPLTALTPGNTYLVRVFTNNAMTGAGNTWDFNICITDPAPANDNCAGAVTLTPGTTCVNTAGNMISATLTGSIPSPTCGTPVYDVWYSFVSKTTNPSITISGNTNFTNPQIQLLSGACGSLADVDCSGTGVLDATGLTIGTTYYVRVYSTSAVPTTNGTFNICITDPPPTNDDCAGAISLNSGTTCINTTGNVYAATNSGIAIAPCTGPVLYDVWYSFVAHTTNPTITLSSVGAGFNTPRLQLFSGTCGSLGSLACGTTSIAATGLTAGITYYIRVYSATGSAPTSFTTAGFNICITDAFNDACANAQLLVSGTTCIKSYSTLGNATYTVTTGLTSGCGTLTSQDVWYKFVAQTAYPTITVGDLGSNWGVLLRISLFTGTCAGFTEIACASNAPLVTATTPGGAGLTVGNTYYVRIYKNNATAPGATNWEFSICITDPSPGRVDYSSSYINVTKGSGGGTITPGDTLEIRTTFAVFSGAMDSLAFYDTLFAGRGLKLVPNSLSLRTNEGKVYSSFTDASDADAGWRVQVGSDTAIQINMGPNANKNIRGKLRNTSKPSFYGGTCIIMATYRAVVYGAYNTKINYKGGGLSYRDTATGVYTKVNFNRDSLIVFQSPGLCPNSLSPVNAVGIETNGTFGAPAGSPPFARNRGTSAYTGYAYNTFASGSGPQDYYYGIANNTSAQYTKLQNWGKPDGSSPSYRVFSLWDIIGDHTGATNTAKGNSPCDTTLPVSASNPCGYMLVINSAYKTDTAFQYTVSNLCPNTYYEISAWIRNICYKCGCDSNGVGASGGGYIPFAAGDSSGVQPNLAFQVNSVDYYTTGNIPYYGTTPTKSDTSNKWVKRGFTYLTGASQNSFLLTIRNNAPGGGGNDWAMDDITVATCLPDMKYSPSLTPSVCTLNVVTLYDTVRSYFNNYIQYKWQRSTNGGTTWIDVPGSTGTGTAVWNGSAYQYIASYALSPTYTQPSNNGDRYRLIVATTMANLSNSNCIITDGQVINLNVISCPWVLAVRMLNFNGKLQNDHASLYWTTSREDEAVNYVIEKSNDGVNFTAIGTVSSYFNNDETNRYTFVDPSPAGKSNWYRIAMTNSKGDKKYSNIILLNKDQNGFDLSNVVNPFHNELPFNVFVNNNTTIEARIIDIVGKVVKTKSFIAYSGTNSLSIETHSLPPGVYTLQLQHEESIISRIVIKR